MSAKPEVIQALDVVEQIKNLTEQREKLQVELKHLQDRMQLLQASISENDHLADRVKLLTQESLTLFAEEYKHRSEFYPDLWLAALEQTLVEEKKP